ncbi:GNAT family N-acetyltransferase [Aquibium microcysteis]|uniref:GNAT family N-acetyltransferase n=1 Tax=Aquibium microcysteis TaxID=675281 RepID=UPI00165D1A4E|nr:GNAT family N-acetyltransferase [Aquibium microcysteis]
MVDTVVHNPPQGRPAEAASPRAVGVPSGLARAVSCLHGLDALAFYRAHCRDALHAPPQSPDWIDAWARHCNPDILCLTLSSSGRTRMALCLEVVQGGRIRTARIVGGSHANGSFPALTSGWTGELEHADVTALAAAVRALRPDVDLLMIERLAERFGGVANPLSPVRSWQSPDPALAIDLTPGFEGVLARASGKRKRKKHRSQIRKFEAAGGYRRFTARGAEDADRLLDAFFRMKAARFDALGIDDPFDDAGVRAFFRDLFGRAAASPAPGFLLQALEVAGVVRAVTGSSLAAGTIVCDFVAFAEDELAGASPGDFLFFENIREACEQGLSTFDFSVGDEGYKRQWCDMETRPFDVVVPLTAKGRLSAGLQRGLVGARRFVKANPQLRNALKTLRRRGRAPSPQAVGDED